MVTFVNVSTSKDVPWLGFCISTDTKPTTYGQVVGNDSTTPIPNGSLVCEMDTAIDYLFDAENLEWRPRRNV